MPKRKATSPAVDPSASAHRHEPEVIVDFVFDRGLLHIAVANVSDAPAHVVSIKFDKPFRGLGGEREVSSLALFRRLRFLAPRKRIETFLDSSAAYFARREPARITATISYRDNDGRKHERRITHDLSIYRDISYVLTPVPSISTVPSTPPDRPIPTTREPRHGSPTR